MSTKERVAAEQRDKQRKGILSKRKRQKIIDMQKGAQYTENLKKLWGKEQMRKKGHKKDHRGDLLC